MLGLRGRLASIESSLPIRLSLFWIEMNICAAQDIIPKFPPLYYLLKSQYSSLCGKYGLLHRDKAIRFSGIPDLISPMMLDILTKISILTVGLSEEFTPRISWDDPNFPGFGFYHILH
jgi:hypothetical protein